MYIPDKQPCKDCLSLSMFFILFSTTICIACSCGIFKMVFNGPRRKRCTAVTTLAAYLNLFMASLADLNAPPPPAVDLLKMSVEPSEIN